MSEVVFVEVKPMAGAPREVQVGNTIGREGCDVVLADPEVSRVHARIRDVGGKPAIEDLGATNGVQVNGQKIAEVTVLAEGDEVQFGNTVWRVDRLGAATTKIHSGGDATVAPPPTVSAKTEQPVERAPSALRQAVPGDAFLGEQPEFDAGPPPRPIFGRSAARNVRAELFSYAVIAATAAGVIYFFAERS